RQIRSSWASAQHGLRASLDDTVLTRLRALDELAAANADPEVAQARTELRARVEQALAGLSPGQREVARLRLDGGGNAQIAQRTGRTADQVYGAWRTARHALDRHLGVASTPAADTSLTDSLTRAALSDATSADPLARLRVLDRLAAAHPADPRVQQARIEL